MPKFLHSSLLQSLVLTVAIFAVYGGIVEHPFHRFDDPIYVTNVSYVQDGVTWDGLWWAMGSLDVANWHPLTWLSHMLDVELYGTKPAGHYLTNLLLHIVGSLLLLRLLRGLLDNVVAAFLVALLWAVHPANVECVAWIAQRKTLLALIFIFGGLIFYLRYRESGDRRAYLLCLVAQLLAAMCKPIAVLFPIALVLLDVLGREVDPLAVPHASGVLPAVWRQVGRIARRWRDKLPFVFVAGYLSAVTYYAQDTVGATNREHMLWWRLGNVLESIEAYTVKAFTMPESSALYVIRPLVPLNVALGAALLLGMLVAIVVGLVRWRVVAMGLGWYLLMFLPTIGLVQVGPQRLADRYLGFPLLGLLCVVVWAVTAVAERRRLVGVGSGLCLLWAVALGLQAKALTGEWSDALRLSVNAQRVGGRSPNMAANEAVELVLRRRLCEARRRLEGVENDWHAVLNLAVIDVIEKRYESAISRARTLYTDKSCRITAAYVAATSYEGLGRFEDAVRAYRGAIHFLPPDRSWIKSVESLRRSLPELERAAAAQAQLMDAADQSQFSVDQPPPPATPSLGEGRTPP